MQDGDHATDGHQNAGGAEAPPVASGAPNEEDPPTEGPPIEGWLGRAAQRTADGLSLLAGGALFAMMLVTLVDVIGRGLFDSPLPAAFELTELGMGLIIFLALPLVGLKGRHVVVDLMTSLFKGPLGRIRLIVVQLLAAGVLGVLSWRLAVKAADLAAYGGKTVFLQIPLAPLAWVMCGGAALAAVLALFALPALFSRR
ncbi:TRAP transporter small permease [Roseospirillum parvum]|uniref:TRAP transporter small permease protein n=1 Tax=Roseospirillum parvum TaxID=83401 RepID=A0A1G7X3Q5_9PROT|nr:TRAP transporter small permease [Roseospirillum parvum]SDG78838.1 TRAP-type C4-dicarboxylate transport system, small permease component [Roseospirillum parvum]